MKVKYRDDKITPKRLELIQMANDILDKYRDQGYKLTLRQLYYQLVARDLIANIDTEYKKLGGAMVQARMNGLTDWDIIEDRLRRAQLPYWVNDISDAINDTVNSYRLDRQKDQDTYIEVWTEKDAVSNILSRVTQHFHVRLMVNRGYSSCSAMRQSAMRIKFQHALDRVILYVGDHDPSGLDMVRDIEDRLVEFGADDLKIIHVALTRDQINEFNPPPNPAKITDPRARWYIAEHGAQSWELDALDPQSLHDIVTEAVESRIDHDQFRRMMTQEKEDKQELEDIAENLKR